jgi:hypothetical protein
MTQKDKQLLIQVLCTLLPYGVQGMSSEGVVSPLLTRGEADWDILTSLNYRIVKHGWRPYLRPLSSMTDEEFKTYEYFFNEDGLVDCSVDVYVDWLLSHYFDFRGLIPTELALEAPKDMYKIE